MTPMADINTDKELALLPARIKDMAERCRAGCFPVFMGFLDDAQQAVALQAAKHSGLCYRLWGGYDDAERVFLGLFPDGFAQDVGQFPLRAVQWSYREHDILSHRDFLGALMALQLKRQSVGDICVQPGLATVFLTDHAAKLALCELDKVGRVGVAPHELPPGVVFSCNRRFEAVCGTAASLRLDCVAALLCKLSRSDATRLITSGLAAVNGTMITATDYRLSEGDKLSLRGHGKYIFDGQDGISRKDRLRLRFRKYL